MNFEEWFEQLKTSLKGIYHYRKSALLIAWLSALVGFGVITALPEGYEAKARIYIDNDSVLNPLLKNITVRLDKSDRIKQLSRTLLSRPNLEKIANKADLDLSIFSFEQKEQLIKKLSTDIKLSRESGTNLFSIRYSNSDPNLSKVVVGAVVNLFIESILSESRLDTKSAQKFLNNQISHYEKKLQHAEQALAVFKREHIGVFYGGRLQFVSGHAPEFRPSPGPRSVGLRPMGLRARKQWGKKKARRGHCPWPQSLQTQSLQPQGSQRPRRSGRTVPSHRRHALKCPRGGTWRRRPGRRETAGPRRGGRPSGRTTSER